MTRADLDIVICTYDRDELLAACIESLKLQSDPHFHLIVVNNHTKPLSQEVIDLIDSLSATTLVTQPLPGLSKARNTGIASGHGSWIAFLDDDAKVPADYVHRIYDNTGQDDFDCLGGGITSWWKYGRPRWLSQNFGAKPALRTTRGAIEQGYNWGSNIIIRREALKNIGGFPEDIGMSGHHLGYAAENIVQIKLREQGYVIGYDPDLVVEHVVARPKLRMWWHIRSAFATGRDGKQVFSEQYGPQGFLSSLKRCISSPLKGIGRFISSRDYYWENMWLDIAEPWALLIGKLYSIIQ